MKLSGSAPVIAKLERTLSNVLHNKGNGSNSSMIAALELTAAAATGGLAIYLIETPFNTFENRAVPNQAALVRSGSALFAF